MKTRFLIVPLVGVALGLACHARPHGLAEIGARVVTPENFAEFVEIQTGRPLGQIAPELAGALFDSMIEEEVVLASAASTADHALPPAGRSARAREFLASLCPAPPEPDDAEVAAAIAKTGTTGPERLKIRQLVLPDSAAARNARERLRRGESFEALSRELSRAPNAASGGLIGWIERGQLTPEFETAVFGVAVGGTSEPVQSNAGWHVFEVTERRSAGSEDPAARDRIRAELAATRAAASRRACLRLLAAKLGVRVNCETASFPCHNPFEGAS